MKNLRVVFMGTPEFAVATLGALLINGYDVACVVTAPDRPAGRGRKIAISPVKEFAEASALRILQPQNLKDPSFIETLRSFKADVFIVVAFRMLPKTVWEIPPFGTINLHASLLPDYRGAAPINHAIMNGETETGVTTFLIDEEIDTGKILLSEKVQIFHHENAGALHDRLMKTGARLMIRTLEGLASGKISPRDQQRAASIKSAPKIHPEDCLVNWKDDPFRIHNFIRGLAPNPGARTVLSKDGISVTMKIFDSHPMQSEHNYEPGKIITDGEKSFKIACRGGFVEILSLQVEGRKRMNAGEFLRGFRIGDYTIDVS